MKFNIVAFDSLPDVLKKSDYVDFLLYLNKEKPCIRLGKNKNFVYKELIDWCYKFNHSYVISKSGLMYISKHKIIAIFTMHIDDLSIPHELLLGKLLGYPICCSKKIMSVGEMNIDQFEQELVKSNEFIGKYKYINPTYYTRGLSLISHVPCSCQCQASLRIAKRSLSVINHYKEHSKLKELHKFWEEGNCV